MLKTDKLVLPHTNAIKPLLNDHDKLMRTLYAANRVEDRQFIPSFDEIHVDEKWFFISEINQRTYITQNEKKQKKMPHRKCQHKSHILKVMFLAAVARPQFNDYGECIFTGKIGIYPFIQQVPSIKNPTNTPAGTWELKPVPVTKDRYRDYL